MNTNQSHLRILIADAYSDAALSLAMVLRLMGHDVQITHDGPSAICKAASFLPNVALLDLALPKMDGFQVASSLLALPNKPVLIAWTGYGRPIDRVRTRNTGFDHHLLKTDLEQLKLLLSAHII